MIEDDSELAEILGEFLDECGYGCVNYEDPYSALIALSSDSFDLIVLDPDPSGSRWANRLSGDKKTV